MSDGILHVNMFYYFKTHYIICTFFAKFIHNENIGPYFLSQVQKSRNQEFLLRLSPRNMFYSFMYILWMREICTS